MAETNSDDDRTMRLSVGGQIHDVDVASDFNAIDARLFRDQTGFGFSEGIARLMDPDVLATFVWLYRRKANKRLTWETVAENVTFADVEATVEASDVEDADDQVPAGDPS